MTSSNVFSFYDAAEIAQAEAKLRVNFITEKNVHKEEAEVDDVCDTDTIQGNDVRDEVDVVEGEMEEERNNVAAPTESNSVSVHKKEEAFEVDDVRDASIQDDDVRDETDGTEGELEEERNNIAASTESPEDLQNASSDDEPNPPLPKSNYGAKKNQWLDRANALNEIRMLLKEEIEQDSGEYFD